MTTLITDSDEHRLIRESTAKIAARYGHAYYSERARTGAGVEELWSELGEAGLLGVHLPEEYGGGGAGLAELVVVLEELSAHGMPLLSSVISPAICGSILAAHASPEMKRAWLPDIATGRRRMAFAITEPDAGSNSHAITTTARSDGEGWRISGSKYFISALNEADAVLVVTRDGDLAPSASGRSPLSLFVVPVDSPGLQFQPIETELVCPDKQFTLFFDDVRVTGDALIGERGKGLRQVFAGLNPERITASALSNGIGRYAVGKARDYARERTVWSAPIGAHQGISHPLAEAHIGVELARLATARSAELFDAGQDAAAAANIAKFTAAEASLRALDQAIQTHGGNGLSREYGLADLWFVARMLRTAPVSREMVLNFVAQHSLGLPNSY
ncbi:acyl-CoA dehydrogenase family protein [Streptomyces caniscabiei]|uniref:Acyl-CoA dehydrogenase n=1 Tax=Streptomyces caniscabiei TaxID=2746961 RepID=A0ABU4N520_9ACTN|nr:acyl-CoA dehydrogenase [Streptomyces caniscabiei]MBE4741749.1 acyl-CoA dehydrogenase [Streptomyces caniscabiei]MBE4762427.1 acyl-CoA dehydrogenase [Streptomyces caniscabiei]MBE4775686.1 acyl-CoA dehydrogenase [Streptomyces caniscabiei]MBE4790518.1 acyl-CoA dehydrogenase [Streptomyces caniscabiei]MBE4799759.1 acyl-CoA dehydrogenase [Streptomyces caniscabiei]